MLRCGISGDSGSRGGGGYGELCCVLNVENTPI